MSKESKNFEEFLTGAALLIPRVTRSVEAILSVFFNSPGPISVPELLQKLASRKVAVDKVTVYRKLALLETLGVIREVLLSGEKKYYELSGEHHHHLVCLSCDQVVDWMPDESLLEKEECRLARQGFQVRYHSLELFGICKRCA